MMGDIQKYPYFLSSRERPGRSFSQLFVRTWNRFVLHALISAQSCCALVEFYVLSVSESLRLIVQNIRSMGHCEVQLSLHLQTSANLRCLENRSVNGFDWSFTDYCNERCCLVKK